ncbi:recombinase family protein [Catellatospora chokoriensis]|uniref:Recombinase n=1 Tax=Catellatospora chokoriensis TaxID=310353 RepID=A0A8J3K305_9ACTN|nr:recombinase family protein [Catellatospora chokoriensis]GIF89775.1 recombinase [Catellatospora chokoriensis]
MAHDQEPEMTGGPARPPQTPDPTPDLYGPGSGVLPSPWRTAATSIPNQQVRVRHVYRVSTQDLQNLYASAMRQHRRSMARHTPNMIFDGAYIDFESGRMEFDDRGQSTFDHPDLAKLPFTRLGGLPEMLTDAQAKHKPFDMIICEGADRLARFTYYGTRIEYMLEKAGVELVAADEPQDKFARKATVVLGRRMKQAMAEVQALQIMELAWDGCVGHTQSGYNIGRAPYGYLPQREPHPAPARASMGATRTRLIEDPVCAPVIREMFRLRVNLGMTYPQIARIFNEDPGRYPPPVPMRDGVERRWRGPVIRAMIENPKYTGHMVWNRHTTRQGATVARKKKKRAQHPSLWVWSEQPSHAALVSLDTYRAAQRMGSGHARSRSGSEPNTHPATKNNYPLRGYVRCPHCSRRMVGRVKGANRYMSCKGPRNSEDKLLPSAADHPGTLYIREDSLLAAVTAAIAERVFGPDRAELLAKQLASTPAVEIANHQAALEASQRRLAEITRKQTSLTRDLEDADPDEQAWRRQLRVRFNELEAERLQVGQRVTELESQLPVVGQQDTSLLEVLPMATVALVDAPIELQRELYDALRLEVEMTSRTTGAVRITLTGSNNGEMVEMVNRVHDHATASGVDAQPTVRAHVRQPPMRRRRCPS